ncbi:hypothetical protein AA309_15480 [Microvirga vignae]|uniref:Uncharacterized protein n=1 Tax=Microvirga vignae TaxID=1225564 RepID=A0A0H1RIE3_9HYPH|nr:hypothetical protein AA309_15480 [Microvirga vignae]
MPLQLEQDCLPVCLPCGKGFPQGPQELFRLGRIVAVPTHSLDEKHLAGDASFTFSDIALSLGKVLSLKGRIWHGRKHRALEATIKLPIS